MHPLVFADKKRKNRQDGKNGFYFFKKSVISEMSGSSFSG